MPPAPDKPAPGAAAAYDALPAGTRFGELEVLRVLGVGGFGIVYLARDHALERDVALKEYMPASLASRGEGPLVSVRSGGLAETYAMGLRSFVNEARLLAKFDHPSLVKVYRFWEANGTAYMVMPYLLGRTLRDARKAMGGRQPDEPWLRGVLDPILGALDVLHREGVFHRDIAPDNIWLQDDGPPILLDFGAARRVITDRTQSLTAILKPSYAPIEQYAEMNALRQGPWTDLYALGAVAHFLLAGVPPGPSTARALQDEMVPLWMRHFPGVSPRFLSAIDWALQVRPRERPQNVQELRDALDGRIEPPAVERHDTVSASSAPAPLAEAATAFEPTRRASGPGASTTFEPTMRVAPSAVTARPTQAPPRPAAPVPAPAPSAVRPAAAAEPATQLASVVPTRVTTATATTTAAAPRTMPAPAPAGMATGTKLLIAAAAIALGLAAGAAVRYFALLGAAAEPLGAAPAVSAPAEPPVARVEPAPAEAPATPTPTAPDSPPPAAAPVAAVAEPDTRSPTVAPVVREKVPATPPAADAGTAAAPQATRGADPAAPAPPAVAPAPAPRATTGVALAAAPAGPATAREACGKRVLFALAGCLERECQSPRFAQDPDCLRLREQRRSRESQ